MYLQIILTSIIIVLISIIWTFLIRRKLAPGPWCLPIVGYLPWLDRVQPYVTLTELSQKYGPVYGLWLGGVYTVVLSDSKIIKKTLIKDSLTGRAPLYLTHGIMKGYGLICSEGGLWKDQRKFVHGCLRHFGAVKSSPKQGKIEEQIMVGVNELLDMLTNKMNYDTGIDPLPYLRHCLGNVINIYVFGCSWSFDDDLWNWLQILQEEGTRLIGVGGPLNFLPFLRFLPKYRLAFDYIMDGKLKTHKVYQKLIEDCKSKITESSSLDYKNLIEAFIIEREKHQSNKDPTKQYYSDEQFYHLLADIFGASLDTTLTTLRWFFLYMCAYPEEQGRVQAELDSVLGDRLPKLEDISALPYTEAALAETQRIRSVVPLGIPHGTLADVEIEGYHVPKSTMVVPLQWAVHMNYKPWYYPELYNPKRFLDSEGRFFKPDEFIPFQTGKRVCVGEDLARMLLFLFGSSVLQKFSITCLDARIDLSGECGITLTPKKHNLLFKPRIKKLGKSDDFMELLK